MRAIDCGVDAADQPASETEPNGANADGTLVMLAFAMLTTRKQASYRVFGGKVHGDIGYH